MTQALYAHMNNKRKKKRSGQTWRQKNNTKINETKSWFFEKVKKKLTNP
jgi:hypothetical protein